jgi:hypothetical protein
MFFNVSDDFIFTQEGDGDLYCCSDYTSGVWIVTVVLARKFMSLDGC